MKNKNTIIFLSFVILVLLCGLYYVIFIYDNTVYIDNDDEGMCQIDEDCSNEIQYIREEEKIKTFGDNYLVLPFISIEDEKIVNINKEIEERFNYYKNLFNKDNIKYKTEYEYTVDSEKNILSLMIIFCGDDLEHNYLCEGLAYNINLSDNSIINNEDLLKTYGIVETEINDKLLYINKDFKVAVLDF